MPAVCPDVRTHASRSCGRGSLRAHTPPANHNVAASQCGSEPEPDVITAKGLTATDVTDDLLNRRSASLNLRFLLSVLLLEFLKETTCFTSCHVKLGHSWEEVMRLLIRRSPSLLLLLIGQVSVPSSDDVSVHLRVLQVAALKRINLSFQVHQRLLSGCSKQSREKNHHYWLKNPHFIKGINVNSCSSMVDNIFPADSCSFFNLYWYKIFIFQTLLKLRTKFVKHRN